MTRTVTAFEWVPPFARGLVRDVRVRWALEEAGLTYEERLIRHEETATAEYRHLQPFGQVPVYQEGELTLFESGAIVLHVAEGSEALLPADPVGRARARAWMFAALNSVEPAIQQLTDLDLFHEEKEWARQRRPAVVEVVQSRLSRLAEWLEGREYLEDRFTAGDLLMTTVLRIPRHTDLVAGEPVLEAYRLRCEERPAFQRALSAHEAALREEAAPA